MLLNRPLSSYFFFETGKCIAFGLVFNDWQIKRLLCLEIRCVGHAELENIVGCRHFVRITNALLYAVNHISGLCPMAVETSAKRSQIDGVSMRTTTAATTKTLMMMTMMMTMTITLMKEEEDFNFNYFYSFTVHRLKLANKHENSFKPHIV